MDELQYFKIPTLALTYPKPLVPVLPTFSWQQVCLKPQKISAFQDSNTVSLSSGRIAILHALQHSGITADDCVLLPAYHCMSMIEPVVWLGAKIKFYPLHENLEPDFSNLPSLLDRSVKAVLIPHFFGFMQDISHWYEVFRVHGVTVIEDCAHAYLSERDGVKAGMTGDYAVCSTVKFFPGTEGGVLRSKHKLNIPLQPRTWFHQLKALKNILETTRGSSNLQTLTEPTEIVQAETRLPETEDVASVNKYQLKYLEPEKTNWALTWANRWVVEHSQQQMIIELRKKNFLYLAKALTQLKFAKPLFSDLPTGTVPYVFPLILTRPELDFPLLKNAGIPLLRWEELVVNSCGTSHQYRLKLVQLPVHQALSKTELDWLIATLKNILNMDSPAKQSITV